MQFCLWMYFNRLRLQNPSFLIIIIIKLELFHNIIHGALDKFFPCRAVRMHDHDKPWITPAYKELIKNRQKAFFEKNRQIVPSTT